MLERAAPNLDPLRVLAVLLGIVGGKGEAQPNGRLQIKIETRTVGSFGVSRQYDTEGIRAPAGRAQWISSPSP